jgi:hypothetical protein
LQIADDAEEVARLRIAAPTEHTDQAVRRRAGRVAELFEPDRRLDGVARDRLAGSDIVGRMPSRSKASPKAGIARDPPRR